LIAAIRSLPLAVLQGQLRKYEERITAVKRQFNLREVRMFALVAVCATALTGIGYYSEPGQAQLGLKSPAQNSNILVDPQLATNFTGLRPGATQPVVITYRQQPAANEFGRLQSIGISKGFALQALPMVIADLNAGQLQQLRNQPGVASIWSNEVMTPFTNLSRPFIGLNKLIADAEVARANTGNPGFPISGKGIGIGYVDSGIDGNHPDLKFGTKTVQNVTQPLSQAVVGGGPAGVAVGVSISDLVASSAPGFVPPIYVEDQPQTDLLSGHGTHGAAVAAGTGEASGNFYGGVARGAHLIGVNAGNAFGLPLVTLLGAYDYLLVNQFRYNIRIINNSWGSSLAAARIHPDYPINVATRAAYDSNMVVVFAAGNSGNTATAINPYSTLPWTLSVAAGDKTAMGMPASFTSRGVDNGTGTDTTTQPADPNALPNLRPDITGSGVDIKSARSKGPGTVNTTGTVPYLNNDLYTIPPAFLASYTTSQGTSFACPQVSGVVALMLEANPALTPAEVITILRETATPMEFEEKVVGAGYVDAHNAVRRVLGLGAVAHPADLSRHAGSPQIVDPLNDNSGNASQDIDTAKFAYDPATNQIVYTLSVRDLAARQQNNVWTMSHDFGATTIFVSSRVTETGDVIYRFGKIAPDPNTGVRTQTTIAAGVDSGTMQGNSFVIRVSVDKINAALGAGVNVMGMTTTTTAVQSQQIVPTSATGGLLLQADGATGFDFKVE
jgi:serine protease AprX